MRGVMFFCGCFFVLGVQANIQFGSTVASMDQASLLPRYGWFPLTEVARHNSPWRPQELVSLISNYESRNGTVGLIAARHPQLGTITVVHGIPLPLELQEKRIAANSQDIPLVFINAAAASSAHQVGRFKVETLPVPTKQMFVSNVPPADIWIARTPISARFFKYLMQ